MSNSKRRANQPAVPQVLPETWKALVVAADEFNRLAPWEWMHDSHVIGLRHPVTNEVLLGSILGRLRTVFALLVYRRNPGHRWLLNTILNDGDSGGLEREDSAHEQDAIKVEFTPKRELWKEDRAVLEAAGYAPVVKRGSVWPVFRSLVPGGFPWHITQAEADTLLFALPRVAAAARLVREQPEVWEQQLDGDIALLPDDFAPGAGELRGAQLDWQPMIPPPEPQPELVSFDEPTRTRLLNLSQAKGFHLELDLGYSTVHQAFPDCRDWECPSIWFACHWSKPFQNQSTPPAAPRPRPSLARPKPNPNRKFPCRPRTTGGPRTRMRSIVAGCGRAKARLSSATATRGFRCSPTSPSARAAG